MPTQDNRSKSFFVYKASAGSGKTFQLAVAYIRICLQYFGQDRFIFRKILAITFTNKAVGEMKSRILFFLRCLVLPEERLDENGRKQRADMLPLLADICSEEELSRRADIILKNILADYSRFSVMTIDSFYQQLTQAFAFELHLPANQRLELDAEMFTRQMVDVLLAKLGYDTTLTDFVVEYLHHRIDGSKWWKPDRDLAAVAKELFNEDAMAYAEQMPDFTLGKFQEVIRALKSERRQMEESLRRMGRDALALIPETVSESDFCQGNKGFGAWLRQVADGSMEKASAPNSYVRSAAEEGRWTSKGCRPEAVAAIGTIEQDLQEAYREICSFATEHYADYVLYGHILENIYPFALLGEFRKVADEIRENSHQMLLGETNRLIAKVVTEEEAPFIYERLGERYGFYFVDEFQDTSRLQWRNLLPLVSEGLSKEVVSGGVSGTAAIFGDAKQAIYRFRSGDVRQFVHLSRLDEEPAAGGAESQLKNGFRTIPLDSNFRSKEEIVRFNNGFFNALRDASADSNRWVAGAYTALEQNMPTLSEEKRGGGVELRLTAEEGKAAYDDFVVRQVLSLVNEVLSDGYSYRDVAVLTRSNALASKVAVKLSQQGVPVISSESLLLSASPEVRFMLAAMRYVEQPWDNVARTHLLVYLSQKYAEGLLLDEILSADVNGNAFDGYLEQWGFSPDWERLRRLNLYERFRALADIFQLWRDDPYMMAFGELVWAHHESAEQSDEDFLEMWEEQQSHFSISNPEGINAVQGMTIHKSKGLAFPIVIYPVVKKKSGVEKNRGWVRLDPPLQTGGESLQVAWLNISQSLKNTRCSAVYQEESEMSELDRMNLDYVAFTRAKERLYLLARQEKKERIAVERYFCETCGIDPEATDADPAVRRYHFPKGEPFAPKKKKNDGSSDQTDTMPLPELPEFTFPKGSRLPRLAYSLPEKDSGAEAALGTLIHRYLSLMFRREDVEWLRKRIVADVSLADAEREFLCRLMENIASQSEADCLFGDEGTLVRNEVEMLLPDKKISRLDRVLIKGKDVRLIDYKTGQRSNSHETQLKGYIDGLRQIGYNVTDARLVYIAPETAYIRSLPISLR
ncbi:MAG: UvrD-helicase domain-containing protein [Bacteroidales bacterium]|nr:UvrD-helicase domain-containing protein [Bacteroidales bacterium]